MELVVISIIIALGGFVQGLTGFGLALVSVPLLSLFIDVKVAIPLAGIFGWFVTFPIVYKMRRYVNWKTAVILFIGSLPGSYLGADILKHLPSDIILITMGVILVLSGLYSFTSKNTLFKSASKPISLGVGFFSGALGASVGEPGPPVIAYTSMLPWTNHETKSTLVFFFMLQMIGAIVGFWFKDLLTGGVLKYVGQAIPAFLIGVSLGMLSYNLLNKYQLNYHKIIYTLLIFLGTILIVKNI
ncbi:hypothetical protein OA57_01265 [Chelonobacter oris]|uniref:Probable membrane transporter protein n=1 Tax=Chelonobacter oris TaxID=505317 RepID=A0A0A3AWF8_9PAST|nr:sulfite exporter TauE/SafE family protein [Chelonobacter oris]KGQ71440.1 hypothetical protein OA57_01265 [Chelonobacter oris]